MNQFIYEGLNLPPGIELVDVTPQGKPGELETYTEKQLQGQFNLGVSSNASPIIIRVIDYFGVERYCYVNHQGAINALAFQTPANFNMKKAMEENTPIPHTPSLVDYVYGGTGNYVFSFPENDDNAKITQRFGFNIDSKTGIIWGTPQKAPNGDAVESLTYDEFTVIIEDVIEQDGSRYVIDKIEAKFDRGIILPEFTWYDTYIDEDGNVITWDDKITIKDKYHDGYPMNTTIRPRYLQAFIGGGSPYSDSDYDYIYSGINLLPDFQITKQTIDNKIAITGTTCLAQESRTAQIIAEDTRKVKAKESSSIAHLVKILSTDDITTNGDARTAKVLHWDYFYNSTPMYLDNVTIKSDLSDDELVLSELYYLTLSSESFVCSKLEYETKWRSKTLTIGRINQALNIEEENLNSFYFKRQAYKGIIFTEKNFKGEKVSGGSQWQSSTGYYMWIDTETIPQDVKITIKNLTTSTAINYIAKGTSYPNCIDRYLLTDLSTVLHFDLIDEISCSLELINDRTGLVYSTIKVGIGDNRRRIYSDEEYDITEIEDLASVTLYPETVWFLLKTGPLAADFKWKDAWTGDGDSESGNNYYDGEIRLYGSALTQGNSTGANSELSYVPSTDDFCINDTVYWGPVYLQTEGGEAPYRVYVDRNIIPFFIVVQETGRNDPNWITILAELANSDYITKTYLGSTGFNLSVVDSFGQVITKWVTLEATVDSIPTFIANFDYSLDDFILIKLNGQSNNFTIKNVQAVSPSANPKAVLPSENSAKINSENELPGLIVNTDGSITLNSNYGGATGDEEWHNLNLTDDQDIVIKYTTPSGRSDYTGVTNGWQDNFVLPPIIQLPDPDSLGEIVINMRGTYQIGTPINAVNLTLGSYFNPFFAENGTFEFSLVDAEPQNLQYSKATMRLCMLEEEWITGLKINYKGKLTGAIASSINPGAEVESHGWLIYGKQKGTDYGPNAEVEIQEVKYPIKFIWEALSAGNEPLSISPLPDWTGLMVDETSIYEVSGYIYGSNGVKTFSLISPTDLGIEVDEENQTLTWTPNEIMEEGDIVISVVDYTNTEVQATIHHAPVYAPLVITVGETVVDDENNPLNLPSYAACYEFLYKETESGTWEKVEDLEDIIFDVTGGSGDYVWTFQTGGELLSPFIFNNSVGKIEQEMSFYEDGALKLIESKADSETPVVLKVTDQETNVSSKIHVYRKKIIGVPALSEIEFTIPWHYEQPAEYNGDFSNGVLTENNVFTYLSRIDEPERVGETSVYRLDISNAFVNIFLDKLVADEINFSDGWGTATLENEDGSIVLQYQYPESIDDLRQPGYVDIECYYDLGIDETPKKTTLRINSEIIKGRLKWSDAGVPSHYWPGVPIEEGSNTYVISLRQYLSNGYATDDHPYHVHITAIGGPQYVQDIVNNIDHENLTLTYQKPTVAGSYRLGYVTLRIKDGWSNEEVPSDLPNVSPALQGYSFVFPPITIS